VAAADVPHVRLVRYEPDGSVVVAGFGEGDRGPFPIGSRLTDRVEALGGSMRVSSRPGEGTKIAVELPVELNLSPTAG
jgi:glucose-6-phosphate-specific signal transduction histidine kinase